MGRMPGQASQHGNKSRLDPSEKDSGKQRRSGSYLLLHNKLS